MDPISFRPNAPVLQAIATEQRRSSYSLTTTDIVNRLIERGAGIPEPVYVVSGISRLAEIEAILHVGEKLIRRLDGVKSRLGGPLNPAVYNNHTRRRNVAKWRLMSEQLPQHIESLLIQLHRLTSLLSGGFTREEFNALRKLQRSLAKWAQDQSSTPQTKQTYQDSLALLDKMVGPAFPQIKKSA